MRLIDIDDLIEAHYAECENGNNKSFVHGRWIVVTNPNWPAYSHDKCSECGWWNTKNAVCRDSKKKAIPLRYCPNCGAKMDEVSE